MPVVTIQIVSDPGAPPVEALLTQRLADGLGEVFGTAPGTTWVRLTEIPRTHYAENGGPVPGTVRPVFVEVLKGMVPPDEDRAAEAREITRVIHEILDRPAENVHVLYLPEARGRIAFGGVLREG